MKRLHAPGKIAGKNRKPPRAREFTEIFDIIMTLKGVRPDMALFLQGMIFFGLRPAAVAALRRENAMLLRGGSGNLLVGRGIKNSVGGG